MQRLNKTKRQEREYNKLVGFRNIKSKYQVCSGRLYDKNEECGNKISMKYVKGINSEFMSYCHKTKINSGIRCTHKNKYEFKWIQEVNELKKKLNK